MNIKAISEKRVNAIKDLAKAVWKNYSPYELQQRLQLLWEKLRKDTSIKFVPLYELKEDEILSCAIFGSGSFLTGRKELEIASEIKSYLGWSPIKYKFIVTNNAKSNARAVYEEFKTISLNYVELDFATWYRKNYNLQSQSPIKETRFFYPPGSIPPPKSEIEKNFNIRKEFDKEMNKAIMEYGDFPTSISLRGYNFPLFKVLIPEGHTVLIDDTHPADMSYINSDTNLQLYAGWQSGATSMMKADGHSMYRGSLIAIDLLDSFDDSQKVDTGILYTLSPGIKAPKNWSPVAIQVNMKQTEDYFFNSLKATGIFPYLWGISEHPVDVEYQSLSGKSVILKQRAIVVGDKIMCGKNAFGQAMDDLKHIKEILELI
ncbi:MAG: hypothetical protein QMD71_03790 [bacterium]|nr:hypothetical protein [bacterium]